MSAEFKAPKQEQIYGKKKQNGHPFLTISVFDELHPLFALKDFNQELSILWTAREGKF